MEIKCKVHEIGSTQEVSSTFKKRDLIVEYAENPSYPEFIKFEAMQDKCDLFNSLKVGDNVEVHFNLRGRPWTDKAGKTSYFNSLIVWRVQQLAGGSSAPEYQAASPVLPDDEDNHLPF